MHGQFLLFAQKEKNLLKPLKSCTVIEAAATAQWRVFQQDQWTARKQDQQLLELLLQQLYTSHFWSCWIQAILHDVHHVQCCFWVWTMTTSAVLLDEQQRLHNFKMRKECFLYYPPLKCIHLRTEAWQLFSNAQQHRTLVQARRKKYLQYGQCILTED